MVRVSGYYGHNMFFSTLFSGITDANKSDAVWCLNTSASEKRVRYAAKSLFSRIGGGQKGVISREEYVEAINSLTAGHEKERKILLAAGLTFKLLS